MYSLVCSLNCLKRGTILNTIIERERETERERDRDRKRERERESEREIERENTRALVLNHQLYLHPPFLPFLWGHFTLPLSLLFSVSLYLHLLLSFLFLFIPLFTLSLSLSFRLSIQLFFSFLFPSQSFRRIQTPMSVSDNGRSRFKSPVNIQWSTQLLRGVKMGVGNGRMSLQSKYFCLLLITSSFFYLDKLFVN